jgi:chitinase
MKKNLLLLLLCLGWLAPLQAQFQTSAPHLWEKYPPEVQQRGFGLNQSQLVQMDDDAQLEEVFLFSADNGHYPYFDLFRIYYVIVGNYTKEIKYQSEILRTTERSLLLEDRNNDGKYELYRRYFKDGAFTVDSAGNNLQVTWVYDYVEQTDQKVVVAYVTSWTNIMPNPAVVTHINYAFGHVNDSFNGVRIDNEERLKQIVALKTKAPHLKVLLSIGGWGSGRFSEMAGNDEWRKQFAADCRRVVDEFQLDGIDIDWEYPTQNSSGISSSPEDTENYTLLMRDIRAAIGRTKLLTHATVCTAEYMDHRALNAYVDFTNVMAYDMGNPPHHHSALYRSDKVLGLSADDAIKAHLAAGVPRYKLVLGMPLYGRSAQGFRRPKDPTKAHELKGYKAYWDTEAMVPYLTDSKGNMVFCYENLESLTLKCRYIVEQGLLGGMYWEYGGDNEAGDLTRTIYDGITQKK